MSRWKIEKSGTGIEKSGTGIEKSGTGIEKSGTGIEKSGTGLKNVLFAILMTMLSLASNATANGPNPNGALSIVLMDDNLAVSWIIDGSVFSGVTTLDGSFANIALTEISVFSTIEPKILDVVGGGTGKDVVGGGTGKDVVGGGTGKDVVGGGTGVSVVGGGTGSDVVGGDTGSDVVGGGTGSDVVGGGTGSDVVGGGTGSDVVGGGTGSDVVGGGTGSNSSLIGNSALVVGGGTGSDAIQITLPQGTDMQMEISLGCNSAQVSILDSQFAEVVTFGSVPVIGASSYCTSNDRSGYPLFSRGDFRRPIAFNSDK